jgi:acyl transferase domain-containing protein
MRGPGGQPFIAIVGMAGRFPDAPDLSAFWRNLESGAESLVSFSEEQLLQSGVHPVVFQNPNYVKKGTYLENAEMFDAAFFGFNPREAEVIDPQHRVLLETAWEAMEDAGYAADRDRGRVAVYAGASINSYVTASLFRAPSVLQSVGSYSLIIAGDKDFLATRISYKLNLTGPSMTVQTACSTSLVAVQLACKALIAGDCEMALAGGVSLHFPAKVGHMYAEGMIFSRDGHCRPFDAAGTGIRAGDGAGIVVLKRLEDAIRDGDSIRAVIRGAAVNNDGGAKMGYTAPSVEGQSEVISAALKMGGVDPASVSYIEAHGTATPVGDPIEVAALQRVFRNAERKSQRCALGSVKSNLGHLDVAAGVAGLIKTVLSLERRQIPPSLHFRDPNPAIDFETGPFYVNDKLAPWDTGDQPRRAGVSSFGIGGTNAHVVLEEAPVLEPSVVRWPAQLMLISARTPIALSKLTAATAERFREDPSLALADACYTMQVGRRRFPQRRALVCSTREEAIALLSGDERKIPTVVEDAVSRRVVFMFSGQGSQHAGMARDLYGVSPVFRRHLDACSEILKAHLNGEDLRELIYSDAGSSQLQQTRYTQPALFAVEYSLARMWMAWGVEPDAMIGHSIGEYVAACLAGVFSLEDALSLVAARGRAMQEMPAGAMLAVSMPEEKIAPLLTGALSLAAINAPGLCTVSGPTAEIDNLEKILLARGGDCRRIHTSHAFHSSMMDAALPPFLRAVQSVKLNAPQRPFISNLNGLEIRPEEAVDPNYWVRHLRESVRFAKGLSELMNTPGRVFLEVGPGQVLTTFARETMRGRRGFEALATLPHPKDQNAETAQVLTTVGKLWMAGIALDWKALHEGERLHRVPLPSYPFERQRFYVEPEVDSTAMSAVAAITKKPDISDWFYLPSWRRTARPSVSNAESSFGPWVCFVDDERFSAPLIDQLRASGESFAVVRPGDSFAINGANSYTINPDSIEDYRRLLRTCETAGSRPRSLMYAWGIGRARPAFHALMRLTQTFGHSELPMDWIIITAGLQRVTGREVLDPEQALLSGPAKVMPLEYPNIITRSIDLPSPDGLADMAEELLREPGMPRSTAPVAYRDGFRWEQVYEPLRAPGDRPSRLRKKGTYLITGGSGGMGLALASHLAEEYKARLILTGRTALPPREQWPSRINDAGASPDGRIIRELLRLENFGAEVLYFAADVCDRDAMKQAVAEARERFGAIHGVIHAAGVAGAGLIDMKTAEAADRVFAPKVEGTLLLESLLRGDSLDFFVLCSSINAICGMAGASDYTSANAFQDAFAASRGPEFMSINWDTWQEVGMAVNMEVPRDMAEGRRMTLAAGIKPAEGVAAFRRALSLPVSQVAVITKDLPSILEEIEKLVHAGRARIEKQADSASGGTARPSLSTDYTAPENETQKGILKIWNEMMGIEQIGIDDSFFELGGHSLLATGVLARVRTIFGVVVPLRSIFEAPTVRQLADLVDTLLWAEQPALSDSDAGEREEVEL